MIKADYDGATLPKCHPTIRASWAVDTYNEYNRDPGAAYYGDDGHEIAFMVLIVQQDGSLAFQSDNVHASNEYSNNSMRNRGIIDKFPEVKASMVAFGQKFVSGEKVPKASNKW